MKKLLLVCFLLISSPLFAQFQSDIIVTSPNAIWTDSRAYSTLNAAITAVGANERTIVIATQQVVTNLTIPSNVNLRFEKNGSIANSGQLTLQTTSIDAPNRQIFTGTGNIDFANGTVLKTGWFQNFESAQALTVNDTVTLLVTEPQTITASFAMGDDVSLKWDAPGNILTAGLGITVSNIRVVDSPKFQIFAGSGTFSVSSDLLLVWYGTNINTGSISAVNALTAACAAAGITKPIMIPPGTYLIDSSISCSSSIVYMGGMFTSSNSSTLTLTGPQSGSDGQRFAGNLVVSYAGNKTIQYILPNYWGHSATNNTTEIQNAVNLAASVSGAEIFLSAGTWYATHIDILNDNICITGELGTELHQITGTDVRTTADGLIAINKDNSVVSVNNIVIKNIKLSADVLTAPHAGTDEQNHLIMTGIANNLIIENVTSYGWKGDAIALGCQGLTPRIKSVARNVSITNSYFDGLTYMTRQAITIQSAENVVIQHNYFTRTTAAGMPGAIDVEPEYPDAFITGISIEDNYFTLIGASGTKPPFVVDLGNMNNTYPERRGRISFDRNYVSYASGILVKSIGVVTTALESLNFSISKNTFQTVTGLWIFAPANGVVIAGNTFKDCTSISLGDSIYQIKSSKIIDNVFLRCGVSGPAIAVSYSDDIEISGNSFIDCGFDAGAGVNVIYIPASITVASLKIHNNVFTTPNAVTATSVYSAGATIDGDSTFLFNDLRDGIALPINWNGGYGYNEPNLLTVINLPLNANAAIPVYTVPPGKRCVLTKIIIVAGSDAGATTTVRFGTTGVYDDFVSWQTLSNLDAQYDTVIVMPVPNSTPVKNKSYAAGTQIDANVANHSGGDTNKMFLYGILY